MSKRAAILACALLAGLWCSADAAEPQPNILFIMTDDQAPWALGYSGYEQAKTPNLDRLFAEGAYLINCFTTTPVCSPSRASLVASRFGSELGITDWINPANEPELGLAPEVLTWPEVLAANGYRNGLVGKWHLGTADRFHPTRTGYEFFFGFRAGGIAPKNPKIEVDGREQVVEGFSVDLVADAAVKFLKETKSPFLLSVHFREPHAPWMPMADMDWSQFNDLDPMIPNPDYPDLDVKRVKQFTREYLASVASVDRSVGKILAALDSAGHAKNTVVIYTSDHGYNLGHNGIWHKGNGHWILNGLRDLRGTHPRLQRPNMYDNSIRVPTAVRWPGVIKPGARIDRTIANIDWYPTILAMAGVEVPAGTTIRGRNVLPILKGENIAWDDDLYAEYSQHHYVKTHLRMYRTRDWKLIRDFRNPGKDELYHLAADPEETTNLIDSTNPDAVAAKRELTTKLAAKLKELGSPFADR